MHRFSPKDSCDGCQDTSDLVTTLNVPAISAYYQVFALYTVFFPCFHVNTALFQNRHYSWWHPVRNALNWGVPSTLGYKPWVTKTVNELLWGYDEPLFTAAQTFMPNPPPFDR